MLPTNKLTDWSEEIAFVTYPGISIKRVVDANELTVGPRVVTENVLSLVIIYVEKLDISIA
jgi:hypothetical protein